MVDPGKVSRSLESLAGYRGRLEELRDLAGLRNRLVHVYEDVDDRIVHDALPQGIEDLSRFAQALARAAESS
jgi:uncharacterized protein YutE (UPF0331/DUF86 family)